MSKFDPDSAEHFAFIERQVIQRNRPGLSFLDYRRNRYMELAGFVGKRRKVYLDLKFWIALRDPGQSPHPDKARELLNLLREGVAKGTLFCPVSYPIFLELMKQHPAPKRMQQAVLMDELSCGVAIQNPFAVAEIESANAIVSKSAFLERQKLWVDTVWTRVGMMIVEPIVNHPDIPLGELEELQKNLLEEQWNSDMSELASFGGEISLPSDDTAERVNQLRKESPRAGRTFSQLYAEDLYGSFEGMSRHLKRGLLDIASVSGVKGNHGQISEDEMRRWYAIWCQVCFAARDAETFPSIRVYAALHAALRMDDARPLKTNDLADAQHSSVAAGYCDAFLTERSFAELLNRKYVREVIPTSARIMTSFAEAIAWVQG